MDISHPLMKKAIAAIAEKEANEQRLKSQPLPRCPKCKSLNYYPGPPEDECRTCGYSDSL